MGDRVRKFLEDARDHWDDHYWRADHPEFTAVIIAIATGILGLLFTWAQAKILAHYRGEGSSNGR